jgi:hypothetical protein
VAEYRAGLAPGSHLLISHVTGSHDPASARTLTEHYAETSDPLFSRDTDRIESFFGDFTPVPPGATYLSDWRPDPGTRTPAPYRLMFGGLARK